VQSGIVAAAPGARVVCFTPLPPGDPVGIDLTELYFKEISLHQSYSCGPDETREALELLHGGQIEVASLITHRVGLNGVGAALERARGKADGLKTVILPWK
jgi:L-iditol 2-dehydrogenase